MKTEDIRTWFDREFCSRYDVSLKNKDGMILDWAEVLKIFDYETATSAIRKLYAESTHKPTINDFKKIAFECARQSNIQTGEKREMIFSKVYVQLIGKDEKLKLPCLGQFEEIMYMSDITVGEQEIFNAADRLKNRLHEIYGGQWAVIDCTGEKEARVVMRERQKQLCRVINVDYAGRMPS